MFCQIVYHNGNCLNTKKTFVRPCRLCTDACPHQAISEYRQFDTKRCTECGACMAVCPSDGFADQTLDHLRGYLFSEEKDLVLNCPLAVPRGYEISCLGMLDRDAWLVLLLLAAAKPVTIMTGKCGDCPDCLACEASVQRFVKIHGEWPDHAPVFIQVRPDQRKAGEAGEAEAGAGAESEAGEAREAVEAGEAEAEKDDGRETKKVKELKIEKIGDKVSDKVSDKISDKDRERISDNNIDKSGGDEGTAEDENRLTSAFRVSGYLRKKSWKMVTDWLPSLAEDETYPIPKYRQWLVEALEKNKESKVPFPALTANDSCTGCGICVTTCPQDALRIHEEMRPEATGKEATGKKEATAAAAGDSVKPPETAQPETIRLILEPQKCVACGRCLELCQSGALSLETKFLSHRFLTGNILIYEGSPKYCQKCGKRIYTRKTFCFICSSGV